MDFPASHVWLPEGVYSVCVCNMGIEWVHRVCRRQYGRATNNGYMNPPLNMTISFLWEIQCQMKQTCFYHGTCETKNQLCDGGTRTILSQTSHQVSMSLSLTPLLSTTKRKNTGSTKRLIRSHRKCCTCKFDLKLALHLPEVSPHTSPQLPTLFCRALLE